MRKVRLVIKQINRIYMLIRNCPFGSVIGIWKSPYLLSGQFTHIRSIVTSNYASLACSDQLRDALTKHTLFKDVIATQNIRRPQTEN